MLNRFLNTVLWVFTPVKLSVLNVKMLSTRRITYSRGFLSLLSVIVNSLLSERSFAALTTMALNTLTLCWRNGQIMGRGIPVM